MVLILRLAACMHTLRMLRVRDERHISQILSGVLSDIGVNERVVKIRRKCTLLKESLRNLGSTFGNHDFSSYNFGSQSEGSTTIGLNSDEDVVFCIRDKHVIRDWADWRPGVRNLLMVQDEATSPGYCLLQLLRNDIPQAATYVLDDNHLEDEKGRILLKNTWLNSMFAEIGGQQNGPAGTTEGKHGFVDQDCVPALHCDSWPKEGREWIDRRCVGNWPSVDMKRLSMSKGCLVVPVGSKLNNLHDVEWRISTSMAERFMMFDLNITQLRCYVMLKIISKTFCAINGQTCITSFMCKCTLFYCIENNPAYIWRDDNLFPCVITCIRTLHDRVLRLHCPHFILPAKYLMAQRINPEQQFQLLNVLDRLINLNIDMFCAIEIDDLGKRIQMKLTGLLPLQRDIPVHDIELTIVGLKLWNTGIHTSQFFLRGSLEEFNLGLPETAVKLVDGIQRLQSQYHTFNNKEAEACTRVAPVVCTVVGSLLASYSVYTSNTVSPAAIWWFTAGFESDVSSSRLKLASAFYCAGDINNAEITLRELEHGYTDVIVVPACGCHPFEREPLPREWSDQVCRNNELLNKRIAFCVVFLRCEASIIPQELRHELFRSTEEEVQNRPILNTRWMDTAVIDSLPYMYFLQYKVYKHQRRHQEQHQALCKLLNTTLNTSNLGHRETAWNLLGQCMEQDNLLADARWCYEKSLEVHPGNNAANFHKARLQ